MASRAQRDTSEEESSSNGWAIAAGIACGLVGAVAGAVGHHYLTKKEEEEPHSSSTCSKKYSDGTCAICLSDTQEIMILPCGHEYHKTCISQMSDSVEVLFCPKCRAKFPRSVLQK